MGRRENRVREGRGRGGERNMPTFVNKVRLRFGHIKYAYIKVWIRLRCSGNTAVSKRQTLVRQHIKDPRIAVHAICVTQTFISPLKQLLNLRER